jgi:uroporphyrinogen decarboxylase
MNTLLLDALKCKNQSRPPVWLMRQAGRYMPEYRSIREKYSFMEMCSTPEIAAEVTLLPVKEFGMDAAILFSDILVIPEALGLGLHFEEGRGPVIERPLRTVADIAALPTPVVSESLNYVAEAIRVLRGELSVPLLGFCGAPFTVASYMIEGGSSHDLKRTKQLMFQDPKTFHALLSHLASITIDYINLQVEAGAQAIQIFDSWAYVLSHRYFNEFSLSYMNVILEGIKEPKPPVILFCRGASVFAKEMADLCPQGISVDWNADLSQLREVIPSSVALQGNFDPDLLYAPSDVIRKEVKQLLAEMDGDPGYIVNLGHGIKPDMSPDSVRTFVETVKNYEPSAITV